MALTDEQFELIKQAFRVYQQDHPEATLEEFSEFLDAGDNE